MKYTYLGPEGTFSEAALLSVPGADDAERIPSVSVPAALAKVRDRSVDAAMVPIENSVEGGVTATLDAIGAGDDLRIVREVLVPIRFVLIGAPGKTLDDVRVVSTHSHAWAQVRGWMDEAAQNFRIAVNMEPQNLEYRNALSSVGSGAYTYRQTQYSDGSDELCGLCSSLMCLNCLCGGCR